MGNSKRTMGVHVLQLALALFLIVAGLLTVQLKGGFLGQMQAGISGNEIASAVHSLLDGDFANIVVMVLGICELIAGVFLLISFFLNTKKVANIFLCIILIVWVAVIVLVDILGAGGLINGAFNNMSAFFLFLQGFSSHLLVLGALLTVWKN